jgi:hypothetical protein
MDYAEWERTVPEAIASDPLWRVEAYRLALFAADLGWHDVTKLMSDRRTLSLADQMYRALGSIGSNIGAAIRVAQGGIELDSTNTPLDQRGKVGTGTTKVATFLAILSWLIASIC